jgi:hypothetical protein
MADADEYQSESTLVYADTLPVAFTRIESPPDPATLARFNFNNRQVLEAVAALEERAIEPEEDEGPSGEAVARLDLKINLLLNMVGQLLAERGVSPEPVSVRLDSRSVAFEPGDAAPASGDAGTLAVYLDASPAAPLKLAGTVAAVRAIDGRPMAELVYSGMDDNVREALEKLIFRHHRRAIAAANRAEPHEMGNKTQT